VCIEDAMVAHELRDGEHPEVLVHAGGFPPVHGDGFEEGDFLLVGPAIGEDGLGDEVGGAGGCCGGGRARGAGRGSVGGVGGGGDSGFLSGGHDEDAGA